MGTTGDISRRIALTRTLPPPVMPQSDGAQPRDDAPLFHRRRNATLVAAKLTPDLGPVGWLGAAPFCRARRSG